MKLGCGILILIVAGVLQGDSMPMLKAETGQGNAQEKATFAAGCFWGVEAAFRQVKGVTDTTVGYMGGTLRIPTYEDVIAGRTGHREVCQVTYDPAQVSYESLVRIFFKIHGPNFYSPPGGRTAGQYDSMIFFHNAEQERSARAVEDQLEASGKFTSPIATRIVPASEFWRAEEYHQRYAEKHGLASCRIEP